MKKRLYVPHPGHFDGLKELISEAGKDIYSIFMAGSPDYVGTGRSNLGSPQIEDIREQTLYAHKNGVAVAIVMNSSCLGGRQLTPAEKHAAQDEYSQITKQMRHCRRCRADAIQGVGEGVAGSSGRVYIQSLLPIYRQIRRICELEFEYATLDDIANHGEINGSKYYNF